METPVIIPLVGAATLANPHDIPPVQLLNQQLLVPLAAFHTPNEEPVPLLTSAITDSVEASANSKAIMSQPVIYSLPQAAALGMNLSVTKVDPNSIPLLTDPSHNQILNQPLNLQSKSPLNQHSPVQYNNDDNQRLVGEKEKIKEQVIVQSHSKILELQSTKSPSEGKIFVQSCSSNNSSALNNSSCQIEDESETLKSGSEADTELDSQSLSKVISSLPPGWKVIGLTHLTDGNQPSSVMESRDIQSDCTSHVESPAHHRCGNIPEVVSVDLNIPTSLSLSADVFNNSFNATKKSDSNIMLPIDLSDISAAKSKNVNKTAKLSFSNSNSNHTTVTSVDPFQTKIKTEPVSIPHPVISKEPSQNTGNLDLVGNEWKVVGLTTSPPQASLANDILQASNPLPFPILLSPDLLGSGEDGQTHTRSPKSTTILNVPTPKSKLNQQSLKPLSPPKSNSFGITSDCNDEVRWTIVGVTMASTTIDGNISCTNSISNSKVKSSNCEDVNKADCIVTNSQQRPVSSSESKNAPLSPAKSNSNGIDSDSTLIKDQWKVVGVTHSTDKNHIFPIPPINYQIPVPLPQMQPTAQLTAPVASLTTANISLNSDKSALSSSPTCDSTNRILQNSLAGSNATVNNPIPFVTPSLLATPPNQVNSLLEQQLLLNLVQNQLQHQLQQQQQHDQRQLMMGQLHSQLALQNQIPFMNNLNQLNCLGLFPNIPSPLITVGGNPLETKDTEKNNVKKDKKVVPNKSMSEHNVNKEALVSSTTKITKSHDSSLSEFRKARQSRNRDMAARFTKKNTVSHLLKLKRMKTKAEDEDGSITHSDQEGSEVDTGLNNDQDQANLLNRSDKSMRSRPLHSYAGNRKIFSKSFSSQKDKDEGKQKINLRSGNQIPVDNLEFNYDKKNWADVKYEVAAQATRNTGMCNESSAPTDNRSSARKRKLKIPRKMVADMDYQPFDSSSDNN